MAMKLVLTLTLVVVAMAVAGFAGGSARAEQGPAGSATAPMWGDADCGGAIDPVDALKLLKFEAGFTVSQPVQGCPAMGGDYAVGAYTWKWGDVDCNGTIDPVDSQKELMVYAGLPVAQTVAGCPALGADVTLDGDVVSSIGGVQLVVTHTSGTDMLAASSQWSDYFSAIGTQSSSVITSTAEAGASSTLDFRMTAIRAPGVDWSGMVARFIAAIQAHTNGPLMATQQTVGGKTVWQVTVRGLPGETSYYYANGDTLDLLNTQDSGLAGRAFAALPSSVSMAEPRFAVPQADDPEPGESPLTVTPIRSVLPPVCVGEPFGRQHMELLAIDAAFGMPVTASFTGDGRVGATDPPVSHGATGVLFYKATNFLYQTEDLQLKAQAPAGGIGLYEYTFPVQHCLNGTWQDNQRVLQMDHDLTQVTANIQSGTLCDEEGGVAFSGSLNPPDSQFSGSDLKVCNPDDCVQAGLEPVSTTVDYSAEIALDGNSISFSWKSEDIDRTYDDNDNLQACTFNGGYTDHSFSIDRLTFGPAVPY